jgi:hypothetical protein|tara:strand:- start:144 stop:401 length:258 start_codon:yes stop_codon:yes gene_type:complete
LCKSSLEELLNIVVDAFFCLSLGGVTVLELVEIDSDRHLASVFALSFSRESLEISEEHWLLFSPDAFVVLDSFQRTDEEEDVFFE